MYRIVIGGIGLAVDLSRQSRRLDLWYTLQAAAHVSIAERKSDDISYRDIHRFRKVFPCFYIAVVKALFLFLIKCQVEWTPFRVSGIGRGSYQFCVNTDCVFPSSARFAYTKPTGLSVYNFNFKIVFSDVRCFPVRFCTRGPNPTMMLTLNQPNFCPALRDPVGGMCGSLLWYVCAICFEVDISQNSGGKSWVSPLELPENQKAWMPKEPDFVRLLLRHNEAIPDPTMIKARD